MTIVICAIDGLDYEFVSQRGYLQGLDPELLYQDLEGANALYTYRIWPAMFVGDNIGYSEDEDYKTVQDPEQPYIWDKYPVTTLLAPVDSPPVTKYQDAFPEGYMESVGPQKRVDEAFEMYDKAVESALGDAEAVIIGSKYFDIAGHNDQNAARIEENTQRLLNRVEKWCQDDRTDDYLVISDHGFKYHQFGEKPSGIDAHTRNATIASSFCSYDRMSALINGWHDDFEDSLREQRLKRLGYR